MSLKKIDTLKTQSREANTGLSKLSYRREEASLQDKLREGGDVTGTASGAIYNIIKSKASKPKDVIKKGALGALIGFQAGDGLGDFAGWVGEKNRDKLKFKRKDNK